MLREAGLLIIVVLALVVGIGLVSRNYMGPDNAIEEASEEALRASTGLDVDLSPETPEV